MNKSWNQKRIPTLLGLGVLIVGLVAGIVFLGQGFGAFSPRATAQTTPKNVEITNVMDNGFTVSFLTDDSTAAFIKYGTTPTALNLQVSDDRDQISGTVSTYTTHYISVRELQGNTPYYFTLGTAANSKFDNNGQPYTTQTAKKGGNPGPALTIYGTVKDAQGQPASGAIAYASIDGVKKLSSLVKESGSWSIPLSNARTLDGSAYAKLDGTTPVTLLIQGLQPSVTASSKATVAEMQPAQVLSLGGASNLANSSASVTTDQTLLVPSTNPGIEVTPAPAELAFTTTNTTVTTVASNSSTLSQTDLLIASPSASPVSHVVNVESATTQVVGTTQPIIFGQAPANVEVTIQVHSTNPITTQVQADTTGTYSLDIATLSKNLAPGVHTVTISYVDPQTGKTVTQTQTFTVAAPVAQTTTSSTSSTTSSTSTTQQLALAQTTTPYGSTNPYAIPDATPTPTPVSTDSAETRFVVPATSSGTPVTGSTETTFALIAMGALLLVAAGWSYILSRQLLTVEEIDD